VSFSYEQLFRNSPEGTHRPKLRAKKPPRSAVDISLAWQRSLKAKQDAYRRQLERLPLPPPYRVVRPVRDFRTLVARAPDGDGL
jgi:hypothetical protein